MGLLIVVDKLLTGFDAPLATCRRTAPPLAAALERIPPQLEAPADTAPEPRESPESGAGCRKWRADEVPPDQQTPSRRPCWRRLWSYSDGQKH
jgi:hypothetical protein